MSADPWVHRYLGAQADQIVAEWQGREVVVRRYFQRELRGQVLRADHAGGAVVLAGFGVVPVAEIASIEPAGKMPDGRPQT